MSKRICSLCDYSMGNSNHTWRTESAPMEYVHVRCQNVWEKGFQEGFSAAKKRAGGK